jgi:tRNA dimethylallyltransferase
MFDSGLVEETRRLLTAYQSPDFAVSADPRPVARALGSLGYRQAVPCLRGELSRQIAVLEAQQGHRNYAKRQLTWFRREPDVRWFNSFGDDPQLQREASQLVSENLEGSAESTSGIPPFDDAPIQS